jgi:uncharacterized protein (DUF2384 family)
MHMAKTNVAVRSIIEEVPEQINDSEILNYLHTKDVNWKYVSAIRELTDFNDNVISDWLNLSVKTLREYRKPESTFKENVKEHVLVLLTLIKHGIDAFGSQGEFESWLSTDNFYFDNRQPATFLNTVTGIKFVNDRLTAMELGDNV